MNLPTRDDALELLHRHTKTDSLRRHAYAVEAAMRAYAVKFGEDAERWGLVGLMHDFYYEEEPSPESHPERGAVILAENGYPDDVIYAIKSHAEYLNLPRNAPMDKALFAVDELSGFVVAVTLVRPSKALSDVQVSSVKKKMKDKAFAKGVHREDIVNGAADLGVPLDEHIAFVIDALKPIAAELGLEG
ncbi:MAG: HDIG domain-containing protein [Candidatus Poribacteria bacterium]|nr:HDIG domain-containing protein [Candidatus Poribacteria bacterium]